MFNARDKRFECEPVERIDPGQLEVFDYQFPGKAIRVVTTTEEFTSVCPYSGLPDHGTVTIEYVPKAKVIELRSLKYYLMTYRNVGIFYEHLINKMLEDLAAACQPERMMISIDFTPRGGLRTSVRAEYPR